MQKSEIIEPGFYWYRDGDRRQWTVVSFESSRFDDAHHFVYWMGSDMDSQWFEIPDNAEFVGPLKEPTCSD